MTKKDDKRRIKEVITVTIYEDGTTEVSRASGLDGGLDMETAELIQIRPPNSKRKSA